MMEQLKQVLQYFPQEMRKFILSMSGIHATEEIRLRLGRPIALYIHGSERALPLHAEEELLQSVMDAVTQRSQYAVMDMLSKGYLILPGGHRIGVCGTGVYREGNIRTLRDISSLNFRIARQIYGVGTSCVDFLGKHLGSCLCVGIPGCGKTTLLRDLIRQLSDRYCQRIAVVDERMEIGACCDGKCQFDLGAHTDILSGVKKADGIELVLRSMSPQWIALDEITAFEDVEAMIRASYCGVKFLATAHADGIEELRSRPVYRKLLDEHIFPNLILLNDRKEAVIMELAA